MWGSSNRQVFCRLGLVLFVVMGFLGARFNAVLAILYILLLFATYDSSRRIVSPFLGASLVNRAVGLNSSTMRTFSIGMVAGQES